MSEPDRDAMKTVTHESLRKVSRPLDARCNTLENETSHQRNRRPNRQVRTSAALIFCLVIGLSSLSSAAGQTKPGPRPSPRIPKTPNPLTVSRQAPEAERLAVEHSSPNADHAIDSLLSQTAAPNNGGDTDANINDVLARRLWQNRMSAPDPEEDADTRRALQSLISRVQSMRFSDLDTEPTFSAPAAPTTNVQQATPNTVVTTTPEVTTPLASATSRIDETLPLLEPATLKRLERLLQDPNQVNDPLEMAELLFLSGHTVEAAVFYEKALARLALNDPNQSEDRAWILFQLGNCLRETDMGKAKETYMKLISQHPNCPWTELAKAHGRLITWYQDAKPEQWMPAKESP